MREPGIMTVDPLNPSLSLKAGMDGKALGILRTLAHHRATSEKEHRLTTLLRDPEIDATPGWFMHVPNCFNDALDIRQTSRVKGGKASNVWTQGCNFSFKVGDTIYNSPRAYEPWTQALPHVCVAIQVRSVTASGGPLVSESAAGVVTFDILVPNADKTAIQFIAGRTETQDEFVRIGLASIK